MNQITEDEKYMRRCLQLAQNGQQGARPNPMVGAVIVSAQEDGGRIIGEGYHVRCGQGHAEVNAFASVKAADEKLLPRATMYVSLEPCSHYGKTPPCADIQYSLMLWHSIVQDPLAQFVGLGPGNEYARGYAEGTGTEGGLTQNILHRLALEQSFLHFSQKFLLFCG